MIAITPYDGILVESLHCFIIFFYFYFFRRNDSKARRNIGQSCITLLYTTLHYSNFAKHKCFGIWIDYEKLGIIKENYRGETRLPPLAHISIIIIYIYR